MDAISERRFRFLGMGLLNFYAYGSEIYSKEIRKIELQSIG
jgi:hypothetical protein